MELLCLFLGLFKSQLNGSFVKKAFPSAGKDLSCHSERYVIRDWDADLAQAAEAAGATVLDDSSPVHSMPFDSPEHCFEVGVSPASTSTRAFMFTGHHDRYPRRADTLLEQI
jgi:hypothetical protein